jgi:hypothetical protein
LVSGTHTYVEPGLYTIQLEVSDGDGGVGSATLLSVPVYDPVASAVDGEACFDSPVGAYARNPAFSRMASLAFSGRYEPGATEGAAPLGWITFELIDGAMRFAGQTLDWLVVSGRQVWLAGTGTVNGVGQYGISLALDLDQEPGRVRVRVWDRENDDLEIYDSQPGEEHDVAPTTVLTEAHVLFPGQ